MRAVLLVSIVILCLLNWEMLLLVGLLLLGSLTLRLSASKLLMLMRLTCLSSHSCTDSSLTLLMLLLVSFVCDGPASECPSWAGNALTAETAHCLAANRGVNASTWTRLRDAKKNPGGSSSSTNNGGDANMAATAALAAILAARSGSSSGRRGASWANASRRLQDRLENLYGSRPGGSQSRAERMLAALAGGDDPLSSSSTSGLGLDTAAKYAIGKGPFKPDDAEAAKSDRLTQCRRCKWRSAFEHRNFTRKQSVYRPGRGSTKMVLSPHKVGEED